jgi:hypothetical protein
MPVGAAIDPRVEDRASADDRTWFATRPERRYRFRPRLPRELGAEDATHILVVQLFPGARLRKPVCWCGSSAVPPDEDDQLARLADLIARGELAYIYLGRVLSLQELPGVRHD